MKKYFSSFTKIETLNKTLNKKYLKTKKTKIVKVEVIYFIPKQDLH